MIGSLTGIGFAAVQVGPMLEQMQWAPTEAYYTELREKAALLIEDLGLWDVSLPEEQAAYLESYGEIQTAVLTRLEVARSTLKGDVIGLPLFILSSTSIEAAKSIALRVPDPELIGIIDACLADLGVDRELVGVLQREAGWISLDVEGDIARLPLRDLLRAYTAFMIRVFEDFVRTEPELDGLTELVTALRAEVADFRAEFQESSARLEKLVAEGNAEVMAALGQVKAVLLEEGLDPAEAEALTEEDPKGFWERLVRWVGGAQARDVGEAALWAALDFVPGGVGVKLGIRVAGAIRGALKTGG
jgi:hypothetical protein